MTTIGTLCTRVALVALVAFSTPALADSVALAPSKDNTLYEDPTGSTSNGQGENFFTGRTSGGNIRRGLIAFDIAGNVPAGSTITGVLLTLHMSRAMGPEVEIDLRAALADWGEGASVATEMEGMGARAAAGDATWLHTFYDTQFWTAEGGDFSSMVTSSAAISSPGFYTFDSTYDPPLLTDVQQWLNYPETNFGWVLMAADEYYPMSAKRFDSRENSNPSFRPVLTVTYTPGT
jgi:hypothetical protein